MTWRLYLLNRVRAWVSRLDRWLCRKIILATPEPTPEVKEEREETKRKYVQRGMIRNNWWQRFDSMQQNRNTPAPAEIWQPINNSSRKPRTYR